MFEQVSNKVSFPELEKSVLKFWEDNNIFQRSIDEKDPADRFIFFDGPPFATGLPHYGHLLAGTIKDIIPRYQTMKGKRVERRFGWDCHGLPVEMEMQNELDLKSIQDIQKYGEGKFNEACRSIVLRYTAEWEQTVKRMGRWVDFQNDYKTMNRDFMESVWWVFAELFKKGLIYEGFKVCPYSWKAGTTLSNFEANLNYRDVQDPAITIRFKRKGMDGVYLLAWTTTPWTLISNLALCVHKEMDYLEILDKEFGDTYYISANRVSAYYKNEEDYEIKNRFKGLDMLGWEYEPLFDFASKAVDTSKCYKVVEDDYVTDEDGVGIVHQAPAYGEDDYRICSAQGIPVFDPVDDDGNFIDLIDFVAGKNIKEADKDIIKNLKDRGLIIKHETSVHSYPFCWRTDTPLIYKAISTWFVKVEDLKDEMIANNKQIHWVPGHIKEGRFGKWLEGARDWAISRNRFWGTPIPIWKSDDGELLCFGSVEELEKEAGKSLDDIHKHFIDDIVIKKDGKDYKRVPEVLDCWFESGSMPYAQNHYPFENKAEVDSMLPADFIAEGLDQTRGWFYTLLVLSTAIKQKPPFSNVIVNGLILAEDGKKMSKRLKNYPAPDYVIDNYGADSLRLYMCASPVVRGESLRFSEKGIKEILKSIMIPLWNSFSFFISYANIDKWEYREYKVSDLENPLDRWILSYLETLVADVSANMDSYELQKAVPPFITFIERLTNWYIRRSRRRFWKSENDNDKDQAYYTLFTVLNKLSLIIAPFVPFVAEKIYQVLNRTDKESVHLQDFPSPCPENSNPELEAEMDTIESTVSLGRSLRLAQKLKVRQPLKLMTIITKNATKKASLEKNRDIILDELNLKKVAFSENESDYVSLSCKINFKKLGKSLGPKMKTVAAAVAAMNEQQVAAFEKDQAITLEVDGERMELKDDDILIQRSSQEGSIVANFEDITVVLDTELTEELIQEGLARDLVNRIQKERKEIDLDYTDRIEITCTASTVLATTLNNFGDYIQKETLAVKVNVVDKEGPSFQDAELGSEECKFKIEKV